MKFLTEDDELLKNIAIPGKKKTLSKKNLTVNRPASKCFWKLKWNLMNKTLLQILMIKR